MKHLAKLTMIAALAIMMMACDNGKLKVEDLEKAEASLYNEDMTANKEAFPEVYDLFCQYVEQNPDAEDAPDWLFKALNLSFQFKEPQESIGLLDKLMKQYPSYRNTPVGMFMVASLIYEEKLGELGQARMLYEKLIEEYSDSDFVPSAQQSILNLGKTPEEIIQGFETMPMDTVELEF